jgi:undecaprenyl-diphosphatase
MTRLLQRRHSRLVTRGMMVVSAPGFAPLQHALTVGTALDLWAFGHRREALFTMLSMGAGATTGVIKMAVGRPRPDPTYMRAIFQFRDKSFPSGHCTHYASFYGYLFYLAQRCMAPSALRSAILATCAGLIILVAPSRVYLGHHWASDVLAGDLVGLTYLFLLIKAYEGVGVRSWSD